MKRVGATIRIICAISLWAAGEVPSSGQELSGTWESADRSRGGIGMTYEFKPGGAMCQSPGAMVDFDYRVEGNTLTITPAEPEQAPPTTMVFDPETDRLLQRGPNGKSFLPMERVGKPRAGVSPVVGTWKNPETELPPHLADLPEEKRQAALVFLNATRWTFTEDGRALLRIPFRTNCGGFSVSGSSLTLEGFGQTTRMGFRIDGDLLVFVSPQGKEQVFKRWKDPTDHDPAAASLPRVTPAPPEAASGELLSRLQGEAATTLERAQASSPERDCRERTKYGVLLSRHVVEEFETLGPGFDVAFDAVIDTKGYSEIRLWVEIFAYDYDTHPVTAKAKLRVRFMHVFAGGQFDYEEATIGWNKVTSYISGYTVKPILGEKLRLICHPRDLPPGPYRVDVTYLLVR